MVRKCTHLLAQPSPFSGKLLAIVSTPGNELENEDVLSTRNTMSTQLDCI